MILDKSKYRKKVLLRLLSSGYTLCPFLAGVTLLLGTWAVGPAKPGIPIFAALCCLLGSAGAFFTRLMLSSDTIGKKVVEEMQQDAKQDRERGLDDLEKRLERDDDPRTEQYLRDLRALTAQLAALREDSSSVFSGMDPFSTLELTMKVEELFNLGVQSLERTLALWETVQRLGSADVKRPIVSAREEMLNEVRKSIEQLGCIIAGIQKLSIAGGEHSELARIREDLDRSIKDAAAVQAQVVEWKSSYEKTGKFPDWRNQPETKPLDEPRERE